MKKYICLLAGLALLPACEQKETTVMNRSAGTSNETETDPTIKETPSAGGEIEADTTTDETSSSTAERRWTPRLTRRLRPARSRQTRQLMRHLRPAARRRRTTR